MRKKCAISSWEQLKRGDLIYKVPRFNVHAVNCYSEMAHRVNQCIRAFAIESTDKLQNVSVTFDSNGTFNNISGTPDNCANFDSHLRQFVGNPLVRRFIIRYATGNSLYWNIVVRDDKPSEKVIYNKHEYSVGRSSDLFINDIYSEEYYYTYDYNAYKSMLNDVIKEWENTFRQLRREIHSTIKNIKK